MSGKTATHAGLWLYMLVQMFLVIASAAKVLALGEAGNVAYAAAGVLGLPSLFYLFTLTAYVTCYWKPGEQRSNRLLWDVYTFFALGALQLFVAIFVTIGFFEDVESVRKDVAVQLATLTTSIIMYHQALCLIYSLPLDAYPLAKFQMVTTAARPEERYQRI